ncbi:hypothetical protein C8R44DRAFT_741243 [Mycena epipterygia]|nr:hypothetical protein C8R44DRAFT_741243 [Mycena epipterygia]
MPDAASENDEDWPDNPNLESGEAHPDSVPPHWSREYTGSVHNPVFAILLSPILLLLLGLFFKISGTSLHIIQMLSNMGVCVSGDTIEQLKFQQQLSNTNYMINATNCAIIGINNVELFTTANLAEKLALHGNRSKAKPADVLPMAEDDEIIGRSPLPPDKVNACPFEVLDINEGFKKGVMKVLEGVQEPTARQDRTDDVNAMEHLEVIQGFMLYSQLVGWTPTLEKIQAIALILSSDFANATAAKKVQAVGDDWIYFICDLLFFMLFEKAVSFADAGQLICVLKYWSLAFCGVRQHNYARKTQEKANRCAEWYIYPKIAVNYWVKLDTEVMVSLRARYIGTTDLNWSFW